MAKNMSITRLHNTYKNWSTESASSELQEFCIPGVKKIPATAFNQKSHINTLWSFCKAYSMKVTDKDQMEYKNPHCELLINNSASVFYCTAELDHPLAEHSVYAVIFTFRPKGTQSLLTSHGQRVQEYSCQPHEVYDPFEDRCRVTITSSTTIELFNKSDINNSACGEVSYNSSDYISYSNGTILILSQQKIYTNKSYTRKGDNILLCFNFTANCTKSTYNSCVNLQTNSVATILERIGSSISITASICLLLTRVVFRELRTLNGKNIMSLASSLVIFHIAFLIPNRKDVPTVCDVITGVRHYILLAMFAWISVMAYDVSRTFTEAG